MTAALFDLPAPPPYPAFALGVYAEELASGARAAIFGNATLGLAEELVERGARLVHVFDPDPRRIAEATARGQHRSIFYAPLPEGGDVGVRDGAFDFVLVPDLSFAADPAALLALVRRVLSPQGAVLIATPNVDAKAPLMPFPAGPGRAGALGYYELYEAVAVHFASVRMIGQAPFVGYAIAEFAANDPEPTIDTSLAPAEDKEPDWFLVLASERNVRLEAFALIEIPRVERVEHRSHLATEAPVLTGRAEDTARIAELEAAHTSALEALRQQEHATHEERSRADRAIRELSSCQEELALSLGKQKALQERLTREERERSQLAASVSTLEANVSTLETRARSHEMAARAQEAAARSHETTARAQEAAARSREAEMVARDARHAEEAQKAKDERQAADERRIAERQVADERRVAEQQRLLKERDEALAELERIKDSVSEQQGALEEHAKEIQRFEALLKDRGHEIAELRAETVRRERLVRELVAVGAPSDPNVMLSPPPDPTLASNAEDDAHLHAQLDLLASEAARREADLVAATWKISQLQRELLHHPR